MRLRPLLLWVIPAVVVAVAVYLYGSAGRYVTTDNAYVKQDRVTVAAQVSGDVRQVLAVENQRVAAGDRILALDDELPRVAVQRAEAQLATARAEITGLKAAYREKQGEVTVARQTAAFVQRDYERQKQLAAQHLVAESAVDAAHRSADLAVGAITVLELQVNQALVRLGGSVDVPVDEQPSVLTAAAELARARVDLAHTVLYAPRGGIVSHLPKVGDRLLAGNAAFAIVADDTLWVEANFKETDLENVEVGQPVTVQIDTYGWRTWPGRVESIAQATGAEFSLLPPQNASGNWVKVVQRIPVRITVGRNSGDPLLRNGMSAGVEIDTGPHSRFARWFGRRG
jgi:membrane fusion protein (multidrug efflux system)